LNEDTQSLLVHMAVDVAGTGYLRKWVHMGAR